ncbi:hypothetical protein PGT21_014566 [Puccinia graminis f. sp. tritici]|uniref:Uncharacterized protein n=2 Tax=Puccinia graminis f. sp. tritici TaxID=56615 RepID=A0A5B0Q2S6_PUCGR|nr:hypothetical protein PGT21_014566 [Puccinia graminis f. sp. tritici]
MSFYFYLLVHTSTSFSFKFSRDQEHLDIRSQSTDLPSALVYRSNHLLLCGKTTGLSLTSTRNEVKMLLLTIASLFCLVATYGSVVLEIPTSCRVCKSEVRQFNLQEKCGAHLMCTHEKALKATCHNMFTRIDFVCQNEGCPWTWQSPILEKCENKLHLGFCETCPDATFLEPYLEVRHQEIRPQGIRPQVIRPQAQGYIM